MRREHRGLTLIEVLVATSVLVMIMAIAFSIFIPALDQLSQQDKSFDAARAYATTMAQIGVDLRQTAPEMITTVPNGARGDANFLIPNPAPPPTYLPGSGVAMPSAQDAIGNYLFNTDWPAPRWKSWIVYWQVVDPDPSHNLNPALPVYFLYREVLTNVDPTQTNGAIAPLNPGQARLLGEVQTTAPPPPPSPQVPTPGFQVLAPMLVSPSGAALTIRPHTWMAQVNLTTCSFYRYRETTFTGSDVIELPIP